MSVVVADLLVKLGTQGAATVGTDLDRAGRRITGFGQGAKRAGTALTAGLTLPLIGVGLGAFKAASDMEESLSKANVVFGTSASSITRWADDSARAFGLSEQGALESAATFGNLFTSMGLGQEAAAGMSMEMVELAADLASFNNVPIEEALLAIRSGLVGEVEPLRKFGVLLSEATVKAKAMEMGLVDANGEISEENKVLARNALIMEQTTNAQGDFIRTSDGAANSMRIAKAEFTDAAAVLGEQLLPTFTDAIQLAADLAAKFQTLSPGVQKAIGVFLGLSLILGPVLIGIGFMIPAVTALAGVFALLWGPIGLVVLALVALGIAYKTNFLGFGDAVDAVAVRLVDGFNKMVDVISLTTNAYRTLRADGLGPVQAAMLILAAMFPPFAFLFRMVSTAVDMATAAFKLLLLSIDLLVLAVGKVKDAGQPVLTFLDDVIGKAEDAATALGILKAIVTNDDSDWARIGQSGGRGEATGAYGPTRNARGVLPFDQYPNEYLRTPAMNTGGGSIGTGMRSVTMLPSVGTGSTANPFAAMITRITESLLALQATATATTTATVRAVANEWGLLSSVVQPYITLFQTSITTALTMIQTQAVATTTATVRAVANEWGLLAGVVQPYLTLFQTIIVTAATMTQQLAVAATMQTVRAIANEWSLLAGIVQPYLALFQSNAANAWATIQQAATSAASQTTRAIANTWSLLPGMVQPYLTLFGSNVSNAMASVQALSWRMSSATVSGITNEWNTLAGRVSGALSRLIATVQNALAAASNGAYGYGYRVGANFASGLEASLGRVSNAAAALRSYLPSSPAKRGPLSKPVSFAYIIDDLMANMNQMAPVARQAARQLAGVPFAATYGGSALLATSGGGVGQRANVTVQNLSLNLKDFADFQAVLDFVSTLGDPAAHVATYGSA